MLLHCAAGEAAVEIDGMRYTLEEMDTLRLDGPRRALTSS